MAIELYVWRPKSGVDNYTVVVAAENAEQAKEAADALVAKADPNDEDYRGWNTGNYEGPEKYPVGHAVGLWF